MSYAWCKSSEEVFKSQFEKAMNREYRNPLKKMKRFRSAFTTEQVTYLEKEFRKYPYIGNARRKDVAQILNIPERAVKIWFQNRRMKEKKDTNSKEPEEKSIEADQMNNVQSTKESSLPILTASSDRSPKANHSPDINKDTEVEPKCTQYFEDISQDADTVSVPKIKINPSVIKSNPASTLTSGEFSIDLLKKYKALKNEHVEGQIEEVTQHNNQVRQNHHQIRDLSYKEQQNFDYAQAISSSTLPQDLSAKSNFDIQRQKVENLNHDSHMKFSAPEIPVYLKGFYAQPYIPPGNMIWKPINVAPMMPTPIPAVTIANSSVTTTSQHSVKRNCNCDCHKSEPTPMFLHQNNHSPNLQYVITAVPFQNPKF